MGQLDNDNQREQSREQAKTLHAPVLYIEGPLGAGKTEYLLERTADLLQTQGVPSDHLLILASNHFRQQQLIKALYQRLERPIGQMPVYTYLGYVRNVLFDWWPLVEQKLQPTVAPAIAKGQPRLRPSLSGLEDSELLLSLILQELKHKRPDAFADFSGSDRMLVKQLVRRLRLRSENRLSRSQMSCRSQWMAESCWQESAWIEQRFDKVSYILRVLDSNKQLDVFHGLLNDADNPGALQFQQFFRQKIRHLLVDDVDESIPAQQDFIRFLAPQVSSLCLSADSQGGTRRGYLNAFPYAWPELKTLRPGAEIVLGFNGEYSGENEPIKNESENQAADILFANWSKDIDFTPLPEHSARLLVHYVTRIEMLDGAVEEVLNALLTGGKEPGQFCIVLPQADVIGVYHLQQAFLQRGIAVQRLSGTQRPSDNPLVRAFLCLMQLVNQKQWQVPLSLWEMKTILTQILKLPLFERDVFDGLIQACVEHQFQLQPKNPVALDTASPLLPMLDTLPIQLSIAYAERYQSLCQWLEEAAKQNFEEQLYSAFSQLIAPVASDTLPMGDLKRVLESYERQKTIYQGWLAYGREPTDQLQLFSPLDLSKDILSAGLDFNRFWLLQAKSGVVADTPEMPNELDTQAVIIGSPQTVLNMQITRPIHLWLDLGSREWHRSDHAPLYHAWVHSPLCQDDPESVAKWLNSDATAQMLNEKSAHLTRTLMLLATESVWGFASQLDDEGRMLEGPLKARFLVCSNAEETRDALPPIALRPDQAPVLDYEKGTLAISAVPGAGKTYTNVALIIHLVQSLKIRPEEILVLTYMDSAAQTLQNRVRKQLAHRGIAGSPTISTIHSLAFKILTENDHARRLGLSPGEIAVIDEFRQEEILQQIEIRLHCRASGKSIQQAKSMEITSEDLNQFLRVKSEHARLLEFSPVYHQYQLEMRQAGLLDFNDLIIKAVELLETQPDIRQYYQSKFKIIIEDEAQDSSIILQRFIRLIGKENAKENADETDSHHFLDETLNLIRTGDTNQSITTTFSSADPSVFRDFIQDADQTVLMKASGRCALPVIQLANDWMDFCLKTPPLNNAFQKMEMTPVAGYNPALLFPLEAKRFPTFLEESHWLVETIHRHRQEYPEHSIAVLVRRNEQSRWVCDQLQQAGIEAVSHSGQINMSPVFQVVLAWLKLLSCPLSLDHIDRTVTLSYQGKLYEAYVQAKLMSHTPERRAVFENRLFLFEPMDYLSELQDVGLAQLYYDGLEWSLDALRGQISQLILKLTNRLFDTVENRSNGYLCALLAEQALHRQHELENGSHIEVVIQYFDQMKRNRTAKRDFQEVLQQSASRAVQVMTLHKAKGQEFDIVLMPYLQQGLFRSAPEQVSTQESDRMQLAFEEVVAFKRKEPVHLNQLNKQQMIKQKEWQMKQAVIEEEARLAYVGFTRAKKALLLSAHLLNDQPGVGRQKPDAAKPALVFEWLEAYIHPPSEKLNPIAGEFYPVESGADQSREVSH